MMPCRFPSSIKKRMNFKCHEEMILIDDIITFDISFIDEISGRNMNMNDSNNIIPFLKANVLYDYLLERKEIICSIFHLKKNFEFIKILDKKDNKINEINILALKNKLYGKEAILNKINDKPIFGNYIKNILDIEEFPIDTNKYALIEENINNYNNFIFYNRVFILTDKKDNNAYIEEIMSKFEDLEGAINQFTKRMEKTVNDRLNEFNKKLDFFINILIDKYKSLDKNDI